MICRDEKLRPFAKDAVREVIRFGARKAAQKDKLLTRFSEVADLIRESDFFAGRDKAKTVEARHVKETLESRIYRSDRIAEKIRELIADGTILIDTTDSKIGQVNGLAIYDFGDYAFGKPSRVTASIGLGTDGVVNIEREAKLSGSTHDKGVLILSGYMRNRYGQDKPLALSASLCFEQTYGGVEGDSASATELFTILSSLAEVPMRQDIAITGSVNQWGQIQAIGGVNEKIEGFYDVCKQIGLTGKQGVCIPASNVKNVILREDVRQAIADGQLHIYPIKTVEEGLELLSGIRGGSPGEEGTFHWLVDNKLRKMAEDLRSFRPGREAPSVLTAKPDLPPEYPPKVPGDQP
jgi:lon-related putative ATP-dependent protease